MGRMFWLSCGRDPVRERWVLAAAALMILLARCAAMDDSDGAIFMPGDVPDVSYTDQILGALCGDCTYLFRLSSSPITPLSPTNEGGSGVTFSVNPALPQGLVLSTSSGIVSGTPSSLQSSTRYDITATNNFGTDVATLRIEVAVGPPYCNNRAPASWSTSKNGPPQFGYSSAGTYSLTKGTSIGDTHPTLIYPLITGGGGDRSAETWTLLTDSLAATTAPAGLTFAECNGYIYGTPTQVMAKTYYRVRASNHAGYKDERISITVASDVVAPFINWPRSRFEFYQCEALSSAIDKPTNTGGAAIYSIGPDELPPGISLDPATATLSGTPTTLAARKTYVLTATNEGGQAEHSFDIEVQQPANPVDPPVASALDAGPAVAADGAGDVVKVPVAPDITSLTATIENTASCCPELRLTAAVDFDSGAIEGVTTHAIYRVFARYKHSNTATALTIPGSSYYGCATATQGDELVASGQFPLSVEEDRTALRIGSVSLKDFLGLDASGYAPAGGSRYASFLVVVVARTARSSGPDCCSARGCACTSPMTLSASEITGSGQTPVCGDLNPIAAALDAENGNMSTSVCSGTAGGSRCVHPKLWTETFSQPKRLIVVSDDHREAVYSTVNAPPADDDTMNRLCYCKRADTACKDATCVMSTYRVAPAVGQCAPGGGTPAPSPSLALPSPSPAPSPLLFPAAGTPAGTTKKWSFVTGEAAVQSSPVLGLDGATLFVGSNDGELYAINTTDGTMKWKFQGTPGTEIVSSPVVSRDGKTVFVGSKDFRLYAIGTADGSEKWNYTTASSVDAPLSPALSSDGSIIFVGGADQKLHAVNSADGSLKWNVGTGGSVRSSPVVSADDQVVFVGSDNKCLFAVNVTDGTRKWQFLTGGEVQSSPALSLDGAAVFVGSFDNNIYAINTNNGTERWRFVTGGRVDSAPVVSPNGATVFVGSGDGKLYAVNAADGNKKWEFETGQALSSRPALSSDGATIFIGSYDKSFYAITTTDGIRKWEFVTGGAITSSAALSRDETEVYFGSWDGQLYALATGLSPLLPPPAPSPTNQVAKLGPSPAPAPLPLLPSPAPAVVMTTTKKWEYATGDFVSSSPAII